MNIYGIVILVTLLAGYLLDLFADFFNTRSLIKKLPEEFKDVYDEENYAKSQEYTKVKTRFGIIVSTFNIIVLLVFWFFGGFNIIDLIVREQVSGVLLRGLVFILTLVFANSIINLPFSVYSTFVIEEKFGFNRTTLKTFITDIFKGLLLTLIIGVPAIALILYIIQTMGSMAFVFAWLASVILSLIITYIAPTLIMPIFNKFKPLEDSELRNDVFAFAEKVKYPLKNIFIMDGSKRSSKSNAFFTGFGKNKKIALFDTLVEKHTNGEIVAILAHEIGHNKKKHILQGSLIGYLKLGVLFYLMQFFITEPGLFEAFYMDNISVYAGLIFFGMLYSPIDMISSLLLNILSRKNEYQADEYAVKSMQSRNELISALKKLSRDNLSNLTPHPFYVFLNYSHPTVLQRIRAMNNINL